MTSSKETRDLVLILARKDRSAEKIAEMFSLLSMQSEANTTIDLIRGIVGSDLTQEEFELTIKMAAKEQPAVRSIRRWIKNSQEKATLEPITGKSGLPSSPIHSNSSDSTLSEKPNTDNEILRLMAQAFDRPAFHVGFGGGRPITGFDKAISDTIEVLNTGLWKSRDGTLIKNLGSRHDIKDKETRRKLGLIVEDLIELRAKYNEGLVTGSFYILETGQSQYLKVRDTDAALEIEQLITRILTSFKDIFPDCEI